MLSIKGGIELISFVNSVRQAAEKGTIEVFPVARRYAIEGDRIDTRICVRQTEADNLQYMPRHVVFIQCQWVKIEPKEIDVHR